MGNQGSIYREAGPLYVETAQEIFEAAQLLRERLIKSLLSGLAEEADTLMVSSFPSRPFPPTFQFIFDLAQPDLLGLPPPRSSPVIRRDSFPQSQSNWIGSV